MTTLHRTVTTTADPDVVFDYLVDFANAEEWDSGTVSCVRLSGTGGIGSVYRNVSAFMGQTVELAGCGGREHGGLHGRLHLCWAGALPWPRAAVAAGRFGPADGRATH